MGVEKQLTEKFQRLFANSSSLEERRDGFCARVPSSAFSEGPAQQHSKTGEGMRRTMEKKNGRNRK